MAEQGRWRETFFCLGAIGLLYAGPLLLLRRVAKETHVETKPAGKMFAAAALGKIATYRVLCVAFTIFVFGLWLLYGWLPNFLHEKFSLGLADAAFNATFFLQTASLAGLLAGGIIADRLTRRASGARLWILVASLLLCAPCLYGLGHSGLQMTRTAGIAFGFFAGFFMGNIFPAAFEVVPGDTRASAVGVLNSWFVGVRVRDAVRWGMEENPGFRGAHGVDGFGVSAGRRAAHRGRAAVLRTRLRAGPVNGCSIARNHVSIH